MEQDSQRQELCVFSHMYNLEDMKLQRGRGLFRLWRGEGSQERVAGIEYAPNSLNANMEMS